MASLYVWTANGATVCRFHRTPSDWDYEALSAIETREFVRMLQAEGLASVSNNAVHPGEIDLNDTPEVAASLFRLVNAITEQMISHPKQVEELYGSLPAGALEAIERRDDT